MNFDEVKGTVLKAVDSGEVGTPVALRLHLQQPPSKSALAARVEALLQLAGDVFGVTPSKLTARGNAGGKQLSILFEYASGQTLFVTVGSAAQQATLHLLLVGNHGLIRLEGAELIGGFTTSAASNSAGWQSKIDESISSSGPVTIVD